MASAVRLYGQGSSHRPQSRRHLQDVVHEFHHGAQPLFRRKVSRTRTERAHSAHRQIRRSEPARRDANDHYLEESLLRNRAECRARGDTGGYPTRGLLFLLGGGTHSPGSARRGRDFRFDSGLAGQRALLSLRVFSCFAWSLNLCGGSLCSSEEASMTGRALLVIADIGGYTPFMRLHRTSLAHAQDVVARLLEAMIDAAPNLSLLEVEGDAAFLYTWTPDGQEASTVRTGVDQMVAMHRAFHMCQQHIIALNTCSCEGCRQAGRLRVKFVAHLGDVAVQRVKHSAKLAGL